MINKINYAKLLHIVICIILTYVCYEYYKHHEKENKTVVALFAFPVSYLLIILSSDFDDEDDDNFY